MTLEERIAESAKHHQSALNNAADGLASEIDRVIKELQTEATRLRCHGHVTDAAENVRRVAAK